MFHHLKHIFASALNMFQSSMARPSAYSATTPARVRRHFGLQQQELADLLGISRSALANVEAERRDFSPDVAERLAPFRAALSPAADEAARRRAEAEAWGTLPPPPPGPYDAGPLAQRRAACLHEARRIGWELRELPAQAALAARWAAALPALLAALPPPGTAPATAEAVRRRYAHDWLATVPLALPPGELARWHLGHERVRALTAEAAALGELLGEE